MSLCVLPHAVLGSAPFAPAGMLLAVGGASACGVEGVCVALWDAERLRVSCCCVLMCGMGTTDNGIGDAGAVAIAKALGSGQCPLEILDLTGESVCLATCGAGLCAFRSGWHASCGRWRVCVRGGGRVRRSRMLSDCVCRAAVF